MSRVVYSPRPPSSSRGAAEFLGPLHEAVGALVLGVEQRQAGVVLLELAFVHLEHAEGEVTAAIVALEADLEPGSRKLELGGRLQHDLVVLGVRVLTAVEESRCAQVLGIVRYGLEQLEDLLVGLAEEIEQAVGIGDACRVEVEVEVVHPVALDAVEFGLVPGQLDRPLVAVAESLFIAGEQAVVALVEVVALVGLLGPRLELAVVVLGRELAADLGLGAVRVHVEGACIPLARLAAGADLAGPGDVGALALVRVLDHRAEGRLRVALAVKRALDFPGRLAVEALLVVEGRAPFETVVAVAEGQEPARVGLAVVVIGPERGRCRRRALHPPSG